MSDDNKQDAAEPSPASAGSVATAGTLRDTFAASALTGLLSSLPNGDQYHSFAVEKAWSLADAMLCERARNTPTTTLTDAERLG